MFKKLTFPPRQIANTLRSFSSEPSSATNIETLRTSEEVARIDETPLVIDPTTGKTPYPSPPYLRSLAKPIALDWASAKPVYAAIPSHRDGYGIVRGANGEPIANTSLYNASIDSAQCRRSESYNNLTPDERTVYMAHLYAVQERKMTYNDPLTGYSVMTVCQLLYNKECCGNCCRHCPYNHENVTSSIRNKCVWNGVYYV